MVDWLVNGAYDLNIDTVYIDILEKTIEPKEFMESPLMAFLSYTNSIIPRTLLSNDLPIDFIIEAKFFISIKQDRWINCHNYTKGKNGKIYKSKDYREKSYEIFKVFDPTSKQILLDK